MVEDIGVIGQANATTNEVDDAGSHLASDGSFLVEEGKKCKDRRNVHNGHDGAMAHGNKGLIRKDLRASNVVEREEKKKNADIRASHQDEEPINDDGEHSDSYLKKNDAEVIQDHQIHKEVHEEVKYVKEKKQQNDTKNSYSREEQEHRCHDSVCSLGHLERKSPDYLDGNVVEKGSEKGRKKNKRKKCVISAPVDEELVNDDQLYFSSVLEGREGIGNKTKNAKSTKNAKGNNTDDGGSAVEKGDEGCEPPEISPTGRRSNKVKFSGQVENFPYDASSNVVQNGLVRGKRFSAEEDELVKEAVLKYIKMHCLGEDGLQMVLYSRSHPELKNCWIEIAGALPWRPYKSVYLRAHVLFERGENRKWTQEELELVQNYHKQYGACWKSIAVELGKHRHHVKDAWRRLNVAQMKSGRWTQEEYQNLFDLVNMDIRMKAHAEKKSKHGMLRDNLSWGVISEKLSSRSPANCCLKWYHNLTSSMVLEGCWADTDDYRLLIALYELDKNCEEDVNWDSLLDHRSGDLCRKRWRQMVRHIGDHKKRSFAEQVEVLSGRYCPDILEPKEAYKSRTPVDV